MSRPAALAAWFVLGLLAPAGPAAAGCASVAVVATPVSFGTYDPADPAATRSAGEIRVTCVGVDAAATAFEISLGPGLHPSGGWRRLAGPDGAIAYNLFQEPSGVRIWGDGGFGEAVGSTLSLAAGDSARTLTVYAQVPPGQIVPPGVYTDRILVTVDF